MKLIKAIEQLAKENKWAREKNAKLRLLKTNKELTLDDLDSNDWGIVTISDSKKLYRAVKGIIDHMKSENIDYMDSDGNKGKKQ